MTTASVALRLGLADVAGLAHVQRPVVSMWRARSARSDLPFPTPIEITGGQEWFDGPEVVAWLETTGRGNNPDARADLAAFAGLDGGSPAGDETIFLGLTALLCLTAITGRQLGGVDADDVLDLADEADPDDGLVYREIEALQDRIGPLAHYCDLLVDAAYNPVAALEKLIGERFRRYVPAQSTVALTETAHRLIGDAVIALAGDAGYDTLTVVDPTDGGSDLPIAVAERADGRPFAVVTDDADDPAGRLARRRLRVHDIHRAPELGSARPGDQPEESILLVRYPSPGRPGMTALVAMDAATDLLLGTTERQRVLVLAPAAMLTDRLKDRADRLARDRLLRFRTLRAVVRLPAGLVVSRPRERLALMLFGRGNAPTGEPRLMIGDLVNVALDESAIEDLVTDLVAGTAAPAQARAHHSRFLRAVPLRRVLARTGSIVDPVSDSEAGRAEGADLVLRAAGLMERLDAPLPTPVLPPMAVADPTVTWPGPTTLGAASDRGDVRILPGLRLAGAVGTAGGVRVLGSPELAGDAGPGDRTVDRLELISRHPRVRFTEPGDVVFCSTPRPAALVDADGGAVVAFPARIARVADPAASGLLPRLLAADIAALPAAARDWRAWSIRRAPTGSGPALDRALAEIDLCRAALDQRRRDLGELADLLSGGVADGALTLAPSESTEGH